MEKEYEKVVKEWYMSLRKTFMESIIKKFPDLSEDDTMDIYLDIFINIRQDLNDGIINPFTDWEEYIIKKGMKIACKKFGTKDKQNTTDKIWMSLDLLKQLPMIENEESIYENPLAQKILSEELMNTPEPYQSLIILKYFDYLTNEEFSIYFNKGESSCYSAEIVDQLISTGIEDLSHRVKKAMSAAGLIDRIH